MKIVACSDLHIPYTNHRFIAFSNYVCAREPDIVIFNGDILDLVRCNVKEIKNSKTGRELLGALKKVILKIKTIFIDGNHDPELGHNLTKLLGFEVKSVPFCCIGKTCFIHGHQFDPLCKNWNWKLLTKVAPFFFRPPSEWKKRNREKWKKKIGLIYTNAFTFLEENPWCTLLVIGHTHYPSLHELETRQWLADCGDMKDSLSGVEIENRKAKIIIL